MFVSSGFGLNSRPRVRVIVSGQAVAAVGGLVIIAIASVPLLAILGICYLGGETYGPPMAIASPFVALVGMFWYGISRARRDRERRPG